MAKASINFKAVKTNSKFHNERIGKLDYVYEDLSRDNDYWKDDELDNRLIVIKKKCKSISGRKMQKNAEPIREAVVNLNANHSMSDLKKLTEDLKAKKGLDCFQIFIHRDEGKSKDDLNYHAHLLFDWQDQTTGKMKRFNRLDMSQIQTIVATSLGMERGELKENSNRERLEAIEYKRQQEELKIEKLQSEVKDLEQKKNTAAKTNQKARERHKESHGRYTTLARFGIQYERKALRIEKKTLDRAIECQRTTFEKLNGKISNEESLLRPLHEKYTDLETEIERFEENARLSKIVQSIKRKIEIAREQIEELENEQKKRSK